MYDHRRADSGIDGASRFSFDDSPRRIVLLSGHVIHLIDPVFLTGMGYAVVDKAIKEIAAGLVKSLA